MQISSRLNSKVTGLHFILKPKRHRQTVAGLLNRSSLGSPKVMVKDWHYLGFLVEVRLYSFLNHIQWRPLIIITYNVINRLLLSKSVVPKYYI